MDDFEQFKPRSNGTRTTTEPYSPERLESLKRIILKAHDNGKPKRYSIVIDGEMIVSNTSDPDKFDDYQEFLEPHTKYIELRTYFGSSPNCNTYKFFMRPATLQGLPQQPVMDVQEKIKEALSRQRLETTIMLLEKDKTQLEDLVLSLRKKLKGYKKLQAKLDEKQIDIGDLFTKGIELFGAFQGKKNATASTPVQGLPPEPPQVEMVEEQTEADKHFEELKSEYSDKELLRALRASEVFAKYPELREEFHAIVKAKIKKDE
jgi:hypothetical protein